jgi:hypothetical protein
VKEETVVEEVFHGRSDWELLEMSDSGGELNLKLRTTHAEQATESVLLIQFPSDYRAYRMIDLSLCSSACRERPESSLLRIGHSKWIEWLTVESGGILSSACAEHYFLRTRSLCFEIISGSPPRVVWQQSL